ncbi:MAG: squalene/phytoene synthase family protein [Alphaproteobacteria bacterium]|nr:squalene/phytoene synthase family protein [Alphaproteobacteria bacterium]
MTLQACADLVQRGDPDRFAATMAAPPEARRVLFPLYAFNLEVARAPWVTEEPMIAEMRLQWWRDALEEISNGTPPRRHEVVTPLAEVLDPTGAALLDRAVAARRWDIYKDPFDDETAFASHLDATSGDLIWAIARALGAPDETEGIVRDYAWGAGLAAWFLAIPAYEARGRFPLVDGRPGAIQGLARDGLARLARARRSRHGLPKPAHPALFAGWRAPAILQRAASDPSRVAAGTLPPSEFRRRTGLLWLSATGRW